MAVRSCARVMRRAHSSRNCVRFWRRCATSSRSKAAVDSDGACGSSGEGAWGSFPLAAMAADPWGGMLLRRNSKASAQKTATGVAAYHAVRKEVANRCRTVPMAQAQQIRATDDSPAHQKRARGGGPPWGSHRRWCGGRNPRMVNWSARTPRRCRFLSRSEEHTSELQSPCNLVCRLLLEKKKIYD